MASRLSTSEQGRDFGMDGKTLIHPNQIAVCNEVFAPAEAEAEVARQLAQSDPAQPGREAVEDQEGE